MLDLEEIRQALAEYEPRTIAGDPADRRAAVAMILRGEGARPETLLIERSERQGDPWSGQMAFPGGRMDATDGSVRSTAERETKEEVGLSLDRSERLGRLDDQEGRRAGTRIGMIISAFVYHLPEPGPLVTNEEVREALWVPIARLTEPARRIDHVHPLAPSRIYPGIVVGEPDRHVVWGLTYRFLESFFKILGEPLPKSP